MVELKVAAKETVKITFGGSGGWPEKAFIVDAAKLERACLHEETIREAEERETKVRLALEEIRAGRTVDREAINKLAIDLADAREEIVRLKGKTISDWEVRQRELYQEIQDLTKQRDDARRMRAEAVAAGTPVYMLDEKTIGEIGELKELLKNSKPGPITFVNNEQEWRPIATATKDVNVVLLYCRGDAKIRVGYWAKHLQYWVVCGGDSIPATHWMPIPEPPK